MTLTLEQAAPASPPARHRVDPRSLHGTRGWSVAARLGWRDAVRHRGRTALAMLMIGTPVLLAAGLATAVETISLDDDEARGAWVGAADIALFPRGSGPEAPGAAQVLADVLGSAERVEVIDSQVRVTSGTSAPLVIRVTVTDFSSPLTEGLVVLRDGRLPVEASEIALSPELADRLGAGFGDSIDVSGSPREVVGLARSSAESPQAWAIVGAPGSPALAKGADTTSVLVGVQPGQNDLARLSQAGYSISFRDDETGGRGAFVAPLGGDSLIVGVTALTLVIIQLTLLAGPAFAVGVRQQRRALAQLVASGADARSLRRVVLAQAAVLGLLGAGAGATLGVLIALAVTGAARDTDRWLIGPPDVPWLLVGGALAIGVVAAVLAALLPAITVARQSLVGATGTARGQTGYPWLRAVVGAVIFVASTVWLNASSTPGTGDVTTVSVGLLTLTLGLLLVIPLLVALLLPAGRVLPPVWRLAMRDSARAAGRSVAAVAAVAAATGGLVAVTTFYASVWQFEQRTYVPLGVPGVAVVRGYDSVSIDELSRTVTDTLPGVPVVAVEAAAPEVSYQLSPVDCATDPCDVQRSLDEIAVVAPGAAVSAVDTELQTVDVTRFVAAGGVLVSTGDARSFPASRARLTAQPEPAATGNSAGARPDTADARSIEVDLRFTEGLWTAVGGSAVMSTTTAERLFGSQSGWVVAGEGSLTASDVQRLRNAMEVPGSGISVDAEVGYQRQPSAIYLAVVLAAIAAVVGGTLSATALTLADARRERAVVAAVGARPMTARLSAGATAVVISFVGALAGVALGVVPGIIGARSQTDWAYSEFTSEPSRAIDPTIVIPWLTIATVVIALPVLLGLVVALVAKGPPAIEGAGGSRGSAGLT